MPGLPLLVTCKEKALLQNEHLCSCLHRSNHSLYYHEFGRNPWETVEREKVSVLWTEQWNGKKWLFEAFQTSSPLQTSLDCLPNSTSPFILPLGFFNLYFLEAWHHLHILPLEFHHTCDALRAGNESEDPRGTRQVSCLLGPLHSYFFATADRTMSFLIQLQISISPEKRKQKPHAHCSAVKQEKSSSCIASD